MREPFVAEIRLFCHATPPAGWITCDGRLLDIAPHQPLFSILGWRAGGAESVASFALPRIQWQHRSLTFAIAKDGLYPGDCGADRMDVPYLGEIRLFGGAFAPPGWALCDGRELDIATHTDLFRLIGHAFGGGPDTFLLPDLRDQLSERNICFIIAIAGENPQSQITPPAAPPPAPPATPD